ncbi:MAG TPA: AAA family ATPase [Cellvibrionaceae bacterium]
MKQENSASTNQPKIVPLHLLTTEILLTDLISGREIACDETRTFTLPTVEARNVLDWYRRNRSKWAANLQVQDCESIIDSLTVELPNLGQQQTTVTQKRKHLKLAKLTAHRFAGLHAYGSIDYPPEHFIFEPEKPITLFEGWNGSGKTSIANALIWCLTGQLLRAQRLPENGDQEFQCHINREESAESEHAISSVTPLPSTTQWTPDATAKAVPADTWVELIFIDEEGKLTGSIRRTQTRKSNGKLVETASDTSVLGVDPISFRLGTTMPGILPFLQVGSSSELGTAVARLTGLADLVDLSKHALKVESRINGSILTERRQQLNDLEVQFNQARSDLEQRIVEFPSMAFAAKLPLLTDDDYENQIIKLKLHFQNLKADGLVAAKDVLGETFNADKIQDRENLEACIEPAIEQIKKIVELPGIERLRMLKSEPNDLARVRETLINIYEEAEVLAQLAADSTLARRTQLYARVASWMTDHKEQHSDDCAVCRSPLKDLIDPETGLSVASHFEQVRQNSQLISKTVSQWVSGWTGALARDLPSPFGNEINKNLPSSPAESIYLAVTDELFKTDAFSGTLAALKSGMQVLARKELSKLPVFTEPTIKELPAHIQSNASSLVQMIKRIERVTAFIDWISEHRSTITSTITAIKRGPAEDISSDAIGPKLEKINLIVKGVAPISAAIILSDRMESTLNSWSKKLLRINECISAVAALKIIAPIGELAQSQVNNLRDLLHNRSEFWTDQIYQNATTFSPRPMLTGMDAKGVININVGRGGVRAPAQHISNASALRASLFGFYLAFREHVLGTSGGINLLVLDDPQELLDNDNRQRLARAVSLLAKEGSQIIATTHDRSFGRTLVADARSGDLITHRSVHPVNASRRTLETSLAIEELDRKRLAFTNNLDSAIDAQDYANEARIFLEARLGDLFDDPAYPAYSISSKPPTLIPLFDRLRGLVASKSNDLFKSPVLNAFCLEPSLLPTAEARRILNESHHNKASISYADVAKIDNDIKRLRTSIEQVHEEFRRYRWREPTAKVIQDNILLLKPISVPKFEFPVCPDIAAFTGHLSEFASQDSSDEIFSSRWFDDKALFFIRHDTLGFAIPSGSVAIIEMDSSPGVDHSLVIARKGKQIYARRLLRSRNGAIMSLCAEATDPRLSRPTLSFDERAIELHRIVGVLFTAEIPPDGREEATEIFNSSSLSKIEVAYRVREESAVPLALPNQIALAGKRLTAQDLNGMEGKLVAITLSDGSSILKRVGSSLSGALSHLRQFEKIGGLGDSIVVCSNDTDTSSNIPAMLYARPILGIIYDF